MTWDDQSLRAFLAGSLPEHSAQELAAALAADPQLEERLLRLDDMAPVLDGAGASIIEPSAAQTEAWTRLLSSPKPAPAFGWGAMAASLVAGVILTSALWFGTSRDAGPDWRTDVAIYQALYSKQTVANISFEDFEVDQQVANLATNVGYDHLDVAAAAVGDMTLVRGQMLAFEGRPLAQLVFVTDAGLPVALCVLRKIGGSSSGGAVQMAERAGLSSAGFDTDEHSWILVGTQDDALIERTAERVAAALAQL